MTIGRKLLDGLRAYRDRGDVPADEWLIEHGYHPKVAESIIERLDRKGFIEYGVSARTGWLTFEGFAALDAHAARVSAHQVGPDDREDAR